MGSDISLTGAVPMCHFFLRKYLVAGGRAVDCTCGNGNDTLVLAELVGSQGRVWALDIQEKALTATDQILRRAEVIDRVHLVHASHERLAEYVTEPVHAVVFNLGYLPGGDKEIKTKAEGTLSALNQACQLLALGGAIMCVIYPGHEGGREEGAAIEKWGAALSGGVYNVWKSCQLNRQSVAPYLVVIEKLVKNGR